MQPVDGINKPKRRNMEYIIVAVILLLGFYLRLAMVSGIQIDTPFRADARQYTAYAYNLSSHGVYSLDFNGLIDKRVAPSPDALRTPGYPLFLSLFTGSKNLDQFAVNVFYFQAILSTITVAVVYVLGRALLSVLGAMIATALTAISPHLINLNIYLLTETLFTFVLVLTIGALILSRRYGNRYLWIASGVLLAFATLIKPTIQYYFLFFIGFVLLDRKIPKGKGVRILLFIAASFLGIFSIWLFRNLVSIGYLSDPAITINTLHHGMYPHFMYNGQANTFGFPYRFDPHSQEISSSLSSVLMTIAHRFYTQPLIHFTWYLSKPLYLFRWEMIQGVGTFIYPVIHSPYESSWLFMLINSLMRVIHPIVVALSLLGMILAWFPDRMFAMTVQQRFTGRLISLIYFYFIIIHIAAAPFPRYSIPIRPLTYVLAWLSVSLAATTMRNKMAWMRNAPLAIKEYR
ncbi:hypothetical protein DSCO28_00830 [Desulfosarcina ovata subsp. sediminis]|uniref:Glycosyltransferase RgtA/B/C/D-like domain-containing protein n=2 Tax=Desulfosarcina ovata TaxID=83564 RepID=A0A5K7ZHU3_9BACT|nr:hypothetical protein DSCO28_00830 [Desulfosarcina ovata subsp. sediminis]